MMKKFLSFLTIVLFLFSCSNDDSNQEELPILNEEIYLFKRNYENNNDQVSLVKFDFDNNTETIVYSLGNDFDQNESFSFYSGINAIFHQSKNEIITLNTNDNSLLRVNLSTGTETKNLLTAGEFENYNGLITNNNGEVYLFKRNYENNNNQVSLIKYDLDSTTETIVYSLGNDFDQNESFSSYSGINAIFHQSKNEIITLNTYNNTLLRVNVSNGNETTNLLTAGEYENYNGLIINNNGELYLFKRNYENSINQVSLIKYDLDSNTETIVYSLGNDFDQNESFSSYSNINAVFNPTENEIITLNTSNNSLLRINLTNGSETTNLLMAGQFENYNGLILK